MGRHQGEVWTLPGRCSSRHVQCVERHQPNVRWLTVWKQWLDFRLASKQILVLSMVWRWQVHGSTLQIPDPVHPALHPVLQLNYERYDVGGFAQLLMRIQSCGMAFRQFLVLLCKLLARKTSPREWKIRGATRVIRVYNAHSLSGVKENFRVARESPKTGWAEPLGDPDERAFPGKMFCMQKHLQSYFNKFQHKIWLIYFLSY